MNLQEAKRLLENKGYTLLKEDADSDGVKKAKKWLTSPEGDGLSKTGYSADEIVEMARHEFGHGLKFVRGQYKFLPGVIRIAMEECGWLSEHENTGKINMLKGMYGAAVFKYLEEKEAGNQYELDSNFNGMSFSELHQTLGAAAIRRAQAKMQNIPAFNKEEFARGYSEYQRDRERLGYGRY